MEWIIGAIGVYLVYRLLKGKNSSAGPITDRDSSFFNPWLRENGIEPSSVKYSTYTDTDILHDQATAMYVGFGYSDGSPVGFFIEIGDGKILEAKTLHPGAASVRHLTQDTR